MQLVIYQKNCGTNLNKKNINMEKFTKIEKKEKKITQPDNKIIGKDIDIIEFKDWDIILGKDKVAILPYLKDDGYILMRYENIPTYQYKFKNTEGYKDVENFLSIIKGDIEKNETPTQSVRRILIEDCGLVLNQNYPITIDKNLFKDEKNTGQYHIALIELNYNDFRQGPLKKSEEDNRVIKLSLGELDDIKTFDLITDYLLLKLRYDYDIK